MLSESDINKKLEGLKDWKYEEGFLRKEYKFSNFLEAVEFVNRTAILAEDLGHHPDLFIHSYNKLNVQVKTHDQDAVTEKDFELAKGLEELS